MKRVELVSYTVWGREWFEGGWSGLGGFLRESGLAGLELLGLGADDPTLRPPAELVVGFHAKTPSEPEADRAAGALAPQLRLAARLGAAYAVVHLNSLPPGAALPVTGWPSDAVATRRLSDTLRRAWELAGGPYLSLALENSFGPGPRLERPAELGAFLECLARDGIPARLTVDVGHHLLALALAGRWQGRGPGEEEALGAGLELAGELRAHGLAVEVLHLHWPGRLAAPAAVLEHATERYVGASDSDERRRIRGELFERLDRHQPFGSPGARALVEALGPTYVVHEVAAMSPEELDAMLRAQRRATGGVAG